MPFDSAPDAEVTARDRMIRLRDYLANEVPDKHFAMDWWKCGTVACIGGWAQTLFFAETQYASEGDVGDALGLTSDQSQELFYDRLNAAPVAFGKITRQHAVAVLDHYLATGLIDWSVASRLASGSEGG